MRFVLRLCALALIILQMSVSTASAGNQSEPLSAGELMALVAGNSLSENVAHEIESRGLAFRPSDQFRLLLTGAGAGEGVLKALGNAHLTDESTTEGTDSSRQLLAQLAEAGKHLRAKKYGEAGEKLTAALQSGGGPETGYVMGELLRATERWQDAAQIYTEVLRQSPNFNEAHTKLSYVLYKLGDPGDALREAKSALANYPDNAEAHRFAGIALDDLQESSAAEQEYKEALRIKPDYAAAHYDLAILYYSRQNRDESIKEYKKSIVLDPTDEKAHYNLAIEYSERGDIDAAIHEYREAKRLNPGMLSARVNLGHALIDRHMSAEAVAEYRELVGIAPDFAMGHTSLGSALFQTWDFPGAEKEYRKALELDPSDPIPHLGIGEIREEQKDDDGALQEYRLAEQLDGTSANAHRDVGEMLLAKKDVAGALKELKYSANLAPSDFEVHESYGRALVASADFAGAIEEFKQALSIQSNHPDLKLDLASAFEKTGDWASAIDEYRQAALIDTSADVQAKYKSAQDRFSKHLASMKASGKSEEAKTLEKSLQTTKTEPAISEKLDAEMKAGFAALAANHGDEGEMRYKAAVGLAEKLEPRDYRLATSLIRLAGIYAAKNEFPKAEAALLRALAENAKVYGEESPLTTEPLQALSSYSLFRKNYKSALDYSLRAVEVNKKTYGEDSDKVADALRFVANAYIAQSAFDKAEPFLLRAVQIDSPFIEEDKSGMDSLPLWSLCDLYDKWNKPEKAEPRYRQALSILEKKYGADNPALLSTLANEARALHQLGRATDAAKVEQRLESIRAGAGQTEGAVLAPQQ